MLRYPAVKPVPNPLNSTAAAINGIPHRLIPKRYVLSKKIKSDAKHAQKMPKSPCFSLASKLVMNKKSSDLRNRSPAQCAYSAPPTKPNSSKAANNRIKP